MLAGVRGSGYEEPPWEGCEEDSERLSLLSLATVPRRLDLPRPLQLALQLPRDLALTPLSPPLSVSFDLRFLLLLAIPLVLLVALEEGVLVLGERCWGAAARGVEEGTVVMGVAVEGPKVEAEGDTAVEGGKVMVELGGVMGPTTLQ